LKVGAAFSAAKKTRKMSDKTNEEEEAKEGSNIGRASPRKKTKGEDIALNLSKLNPED